MLAGVTEARRSPYEISGSKRQQTSDNSTTDP